MNEAETRAELIDPLLAAAGWGVVEGSRIRREFSITPGRIEGGGRRGKPLTADYVLTYRNTQQARLYIHSRFTSKQQLFLDFVLQHYVSSGVQELAQEKLAPLLLLRYQNSIADAVADLGQPVEIGRLFANFQRYLYEPQNSA